VIFEDRHHLIIVEQRYPVEQSIEETGRILVESLASAVDRHVIVYELDQFFTRVESLPHEIFLNAVEMVQISCVQDCIAYLSPSKIEKTSSILNRRHSRNDISTGIALELLRKVLEECSGIESDVDA
jgi:hypothetical protein